MSEKIYFAEPVSFSHVQVHKGIQSDRHTENVTNKKFQLPGSDTFHKRLGGHGVHSSVGDMICPFDVQHYAINRS